MVCKHRRFKWICFSLILVLTISAFLYYRAQIESEEQYYRNFYRADIEIAQQYYYSYQKVYDTIVKSNYDSSTMIAFFESADYAETVQQMTEQIDKRKKLYAQYPVVDFSKLKSVENTIQSLKKFYDWVLSEEFDPQYTKDYFFLLGLKQNHVEDLAHLEKWLSDPKFPRKSDNYVNNTLGKTMLVTDLHSC